MVELHREGSAPTACAAGLLLVALGNLTCTNGIVLPHRGLATLGSAFYGRRQVALGIAQ